MITEILIGIGCLILGIVLAYAFIHYDAKRTLIPDNLILLRKNESLSIWMQEQEDKKHFEKYEQKRLTYQCEVIIDEVYLTQKAIRETPILFERITSEQLEEVTSRYEKYIIACDQLGCTTRLSKEEFL